MERLDPCSDDNARALQFSFPQCACFPRPASTMKLGEIGENRLVEQLLRGRATRRDVIAGPGDDCAVVDLIADRLALLKTDCVVEKVHFLPNEKPRAVGWKAMMRTLSDFAAMSGRPH